MTHYHSLFAAALLLAAGTAVTSCSTDDTTTDNQTTQEAARRAHVRLLCSVPTVTPPRQATAVTRAAMTANGKSITDLYIMDYDKTTGALLQVLHQTSEASDFAEPDLTLDYGEHTLRIIATRSDAPRLLTADGTAWSITANTMTATTGSDTPTLLTADKTSDTFAAEVDVTVKTGTAQSIGVTLERNVARLIINSTDDFPADCATLDLTMDEYKAVRLADLYVIDPAKNHRITDVSALAGQSGTTITYYVLAPAEGYTTDITITPTRTTGDPYQSITLTDVPLERNKTTTITGSIYGHQQGMRIGLNDEWDAEGHDINL